ncbi:hypothetical protein ACIP69_18345 [Streptomyces hygroscopicus]|uniref:hypothetical protein n=1 Tax=Streptomyces hygroscopicus TaxID=1912 RepID=UPI003813A1FD
MSRTWKWSIVIRKGREEGKASGEVIAPDSATGKTVMENVVRMLIDQRPSMNGCTVVHFEAECI